MNHRHRKVLHSLFAHPVSANLHFKDIEHVFGELGAEISHNHQGRLHVALNGHSANFSTSSHSVPKTEVAGIRKFLEICGIDPEKNFPL